MEKIDLSKYRFGNLPEYPISVPFDELRALVELAQAAKRVCKLNGDESQDEAWQAFVAARERFA